MSDIANVDMAPKMEGNHMTMILAPNTDAIKKAKDSKKPKNPVLWWWTSI